MASSSTKICIVKPGRRSFKNFNLLSAIVLVFLSFFSTTVYAQISVTVTNPGNTTPALAASYTSFANALTDLNNRTAMSGPVILTLNGGNETVSNTGLTIGSTSLNAVLSSTNTVTVNTSATSTLNAGTGGTATPTTAVQNGILKIAGADYVTIDGLTLVDGNAANPATMEFGIGIFKLTTIDGAQNNTIQNCTITLNRINNASATAPAIEGSKGIMLSSSLPTTMTTITAPTAASGTNSNNKFYHNTIQNCNYGIGLIGYAAATPFTLADFGNDIGGNASGTGNTIINYGGGAATNPAAAIRTLAQYNLNVSYNIINNNNGSGASHATTLRGIYINTALSASSTISHNDITLKSAAATSVLTAIENASGSTAASNTVSITFNNIHDCTYTTATSGTMLGIDNGGTPQLIEISNNTITNNTLPGTGAFTGIDGGTSNNNQQINNNTVTNNTKSGASGTMICIRSGTGVTVMNGNTITNNGLTLGSGASAGIVYGCYNIGSPTSETYTNNIINNLFVTSFTTSAACIIYGIQTTGDGTKNISGNTIHTLTTSNGVGGGTVIGINNNSGTQIDIFKNKIYDLSSGGASGRLHGIANTLGTTTNIFNNLIGNLSTPAANSATAITTITTGSGVYGITAISGTNVNAYNNTVYINATSTGSDFNSSAVLATSTPVVELRNNILVNTSTPGATGYASAYKRTSTALVTYATTSNNNLLYAGTPSARKLIFWDGTAGDQTLLEYKARVTPADANSIDENPTFVSTTGSAGTFLHINTSVATQIESGGSPVAGLTDDFDGDTRNVSTPDIGADEFSGTPAVVVNINSISINPTGNLCVAASRTVTANVTSGSTNLTSVSVYYSINGAAPVSSAMNGGNTNPNTASTWTGTIPVAVPADATIEWGVVAVDGITSKLSIGTPYRDEPLNDATLVITANPNPVCAGSSTQLSVTATTPPKNANIGGGTTTSTTYNGPFYSAYSNKHLQLMVRASEISAAGLGSGNITHLTFYTTSVDATDFNQNFSIKMTQTAQTDLSTFVTTGLTEVYFAATYTQVVGTNLFTLSTPFNWNGTSNIVVDICFANTVSSATLSSTATADPTTFVSVIKTHVAASTLPGTICPNTTDNILTYSVRPRVTFKGNGATNLVSYVWNDGTSNIGTTNPITVTVPSNTNYTVTATDINGCSKISSAYTVTTLTLPPSPNGNNATQCGTAIPGVFVTSGGAGGGYKWYDAQTGGNLLQTGGPTYTGSISTTTTFWVSESNGTCESLRTAVVATVTQPDPIDASVDNNNPCANSTIQLSVTNTAASPLNTYTYSWSASPLSGSGMSGTQAGNTLNIMPTQAGTYTYTVIAIDDDCSVTDQVVIVVKPLPEITATSATPSAFCSGLTTTLSAQSIPTHVETVTFGAGATTTSTYNAPFYSSSSNKHQQIMYLASELTAAGLVAGNITALGFPTTAGTSSLTNFTVKLTQTIAINMSSFVMLGLTQVYTNPTQQQFPGTNNIITFTTPYHWDGTSNLVVDICFGNESSSSSTPSTSPADNTSFVSVIKTYTSAATAASVACPNITTTSSTYSVRPKVLIEGIIGTNVTNSLTWSWNPGALAGHTVTAAPATTTLYTVTATNPANSCSVSQTLNVTVYDLPPAVSTNNSEHCGTALAAASVSSNSLVPSPVFNWYSAPTGGTLLQSGTSTTYTTPVSSTTNFYVSEVSAQGCEGPRALLTASVIDADLISAGSSSAAVCPNTPVTLTATQTGSTNTYVYTWTATPATGSGIPVEEIGNPVFVTPTASGTYTFTVTGVDPDKGCSTTAQVVVTANPVPVISTVTATPATICAGSPTQLEAQSHIGAQLIKKIGTGTTGFSGAGNPYWRSGEGAKFQFLYRAADLQAIGLTAGVINGIVFKVTTTPVTAASFFNNFKISMGHTGTTTLSATWETGLTQVKNPINHTPVTGDNPYVFDNAFTWDGTSNIVIQVCFDNDTNASCSSCTGSTLSTEYTSSVGYNASSYYYENNTANANRDMCASTEAASTQTGRINVGFMQGNGNNTSSYTWLWNPGGATTAITTASPSATTTYTVTATAANGCTNSAPVTVNVLNLPDQPVANNSTQCGVGIPTASVSTGGANGSFKWYSAQTGGTLLQTGGTTYTSPVSSTTTLWVSESNGNCESLRTPVVVTVNQPDAVTAIVDDNTVCIGTTIQLTANQTGSTNNYVYTWTASPAAGSGIPTNIAGSPVNVTPTAAGTYTYTVTAVDATEGCTISSTVSVAVGAYPIITSVSATPSTVCSGSPVQLTATSLQPTPLNIKIGTGTTGFTGAANPYWRGAEGSKGQTLYLASDLINAGFSAGPIDGISFRILTAPAAGVYYDNFRMALAQTSLTVVAHPMQTTGFQEVYTSSHFEPVLGVNAHMFASPFVWDGVSNILIQTCFDNDPHNTCASGCEGSTPSVEYTSAIGYNASLYVYGDNTTLTDRDQCTSPTGTSSSPQANRPNATFIRSFVNNPGVYNWTWNPGNVSGFNVTVNPTSTTSYTATATDPVTGCATQSSATVVTVNPVPATPTATNSTQCGLAVPTASVSGAGGTYNWYSAPTGGILLQSSPSTTYSTAISSTTTFYVAENNGDCESGRIAVTVTVNTPDPVSASVNDNSICPNESIQLSASNTAASPVNTYTFVWTASPVNGSGIPTNVSGSPATVTPTAAGTYTYTVVGTDATLGCATSATVTVTVNPTPVISSATATPSTVCAGANVNLVGASVVASAGTATFGTGSTTNNTYPAPFYSLYSNKHEQIMIKASELVAAGVAPGNITSLTFYTTVIDGTDLNQNFAIKLAQTTATDMSAFVTTGLTQVYSIATYSQVVGANLFNFTTPFSWDGTSNLIVDVCFGNAGSSATLSSTATVDNTSFISVIKSHTSSATASATSCPDVTTNLVTYTSRPRITIGAQVGVVLTGNYNWVWNPGAISGASTTVNPTTTTTYTVTATNPTTTCASSAPVTVTVNPIPAVPTATNSSQCGLHVPTASVSGAGGTYNWYNAPAGGTLLQSSTSTTYQTPISSTTTFYVAENNGNCESGRVAVTVTVSTPDPVSASVDDNSSCPNQVLQLSATNTAASPVANYLYTWTANPSAGSGIASSITGSPVTIAPTTAGTYTYTVLADDAGLGCVTTATVAVTVNPVPVITSATSTPSAVCAGSPVQLNAESIIFSPVSIKRGTGTTGFSGAGNPYWRGNSADGSRFQFLYKASDLTSLGLTAGPIDAIKLKITTNPVTAASYFNGFAISMGHTAVAALTATWQPNMQLVKNPFDHLPVTGDNTYNFDNSFIWDGTSNIVIQFCYNNDLTGTCTTCTGSTLNVEYTASAYTGASAYYYELITTANRDMCGATNAATLQTGLPNVTFIRNYLNNTPNLNWSWNPGALTGSTVTASPTTTTTYTVTATIPSTGCSSTATTGVNVTARPTAAISGSGTFCQGAANTSTNLTVNFTGTAPWNYTYTTNGGSPVSGTTSSNPLTITVSPGSASPALFTYEVSALSDANCTSIAADLNGSGTVTINPLAASPTAVVSVQPTCAVGTGTITVTAPLGTGNSYTLDGTTTIAWPTVSFTGVAPGPHTITVSNSFGCSAPASTSVTVDPQPFIPGTPVVTGIVNVCPFIGTTTQITYHATATGNGTQVFNWVIPTTNVTIISGQGTANLTVTFQNGFAAQANKQLRLTVTNQCGTSPMTIYYLLAQFPNTPNPITGPTNVCALIGTATTATYTTNKAAGALTYNWSTPANTVVSHPNGAGVNDTTIVVTFNTGFTGGNISVVAENLCGPSGTRTLTIVNTPPSTPGLISGPTNGCPHVAPGGTAATYSIALVPFATSYNWTVTPATAVVTHPNGAGANDYTITVLYPVGFASGSITVSATNGCGTGGVRSLSVTKLNPATPSVIDVIQTHFCGEAGGRKYTYTLASMPANATSVLWTVPAGATFINLSAISIEVTYPDVAVNGFVTAQATSNCAVSTIRSTTVKLPACPPPGFAAGKGETITPGPITKAMEVKIFPNPTVSDFQLQVLTSGSEEIKVRVMDNLGRVYKSFKMMPYQTIALGAELKAGSYMVEVRQGTEVKTKKVIKF